MIICKDCGRTVNESYIFCPWCGKSKADRISNMSEKELLIETIKKKRYEEQTIKIMELNKKLEDLERDLSILVLSAEMHK
ncbi:MAG: hypothetical protein IJZ27_01450 [Treponema sp.]|nr:hypothetical protein [Treponema bryantii]MBQ8211182.1 hypothetical protein [Treponema sp.]